MKLTDYHAKYYSYELTKRCASDEIEKLTSTLSDAQVDLNPHQVDAALFAFKSPLSKGAILADEVGLGKTIEAGILLSQKWAERKRKILIITPSNLRKQWNQELLDKFFLQSVVLEAKSFNDFIRQGILNPFDQEIIKICSYNFARDKEAYIKLVNWDLVIIDEAHRLRNVYKNTNKISRSIKDSLQNSSKILLTATPLQNSLLELYGLVSIIDNYTFGDLKSFKEKFTRVSENKKDSYDDLKQRLEPICKRTLRRQITEYVNFTVRRALTQEFSPYENENQLYEYVSDYLIEGKLKALPQGQRHLMTLILRKLLASSTFAISGTLKSLANKLKDMLKPAYSKNNLEEIFEDYEAANDIIDEAEDDLIDVPQQLTEQDVMDIEEELNKLEKFVALAESIKSNAKGDVLKEAIYKGFNEAKKLGSEKKALIFTESRRTQDYLYKILSETEFAGSIVLFNGTNSDKESNRIYNEWLKKHAGTDRITGSKTADRRAAIVDYFRDTAKIMIATEAGAEGINLQFCSLVINYDLPWNPQRIEQRIGRCHRYGQKCDVVVINFINKNNAADQRVYELLSEKFKLFDGVFGASDEVLGAIESGVDFEKRINEIYQNCKKPEDIKASFDALQKELEDTINERMNWTRQKLFENFDEEVTEKLRSSREESRNYIDRYERKLWELAVYRLDANATFDDENKKFELLNNPYKDELIPTGVYYLSKNIEEGHRFRIGHPLAQNIIEEYKNFKLCDSEIIFEYSGRKPAIAVLESLVGKSGELCLWNITIKTFELENHLIFSGCTDSGDELDIEQCEKLFKLSGEVKGAVSIAFEDKLSNMFYVRKNIVLQQVSERNMKFFEEEIEKLEKWSEDVKNSIEIELRELDIEIKSLKTESKKIPVLEEKVKAQRHIKELEKKRNVLRLNLFDELDKVDEKKDVLISDVEARLKQKVEVERLFSVRWRVV